MFKNGFFYITLFLLGFGGVGCSSNSGSGEDLDISEIQEIEATGEFSEDEFFSDDGKSDVAEEQLVEEVPDLDSELAADMDLKADLGEGNEDDFALDLAEDVSVDAQLEGQDLFAVDAEEDTDVPVEEGAAKKNVTVTAEDLGFDDELDLSDDTETTVADAGEELQLDSEEDLFRDADLSAEASPAAEGKDEFIEDVTVAEVDPAVDTLSEEDSLETTDYGSGDVSAKGAAELLAEDVSIDDVDYSNTEVTPKVARNFISVKKMKTVPYSKNGILVNAIYFVRTGDTLASIGERIYGNGSAVDFRIVNPHLRKDNLKVGQKIYYNSPTRSQDRSRLLTYYEDVRIPAKTYSAAEGENIRTLAKNLLGHPRSWMEIWATNQQIESKGLLTSATQVRYWDGGELSPAPVLASTKPQAVPAVRAEEASSQANLDLNPIEEPFEEDMAGDVAGLDEPIVEEPTALNEPDMELDEPAEVGLDDSDFAAADEDLMAENNQMGATNEVPTETSATDNKGASARLAEADGRDIARNNGAFPAKNSGIMGDSTTRMGIVGLALLLLLAVGFLVVRRRKQSQNAIEMESFDFGGETTIEEAQTKTQIDL